MVVSLKEVRMKIKSHLNKKIKMAIQTKIQM
jgi:hypothetical protein